MYLIRNTWILRFAQDDILKLMYRTCGTAHSQAAEKLVGVSS